MAGKGQKDVFTEEDLRTDPVMISQLLQKKCIGAMEDYRKQMALEVKHPKLEINAKWRNICSKLRNNDENRKLLQKKEQKSSKNNKYFDGKIYFKKY